MNKPTKIFDFKKGMRVDIDYQRGPRAYMWRNRDSRLVGTIVRIVNSDTLEHYYRYYLRIRLENGMEQSFWPVECIPEGYVDDPRGELIGKINEMWERHGKIRPASSVPFMRK